MTIFLRILLIIVFLILQTTLLSPSRLYGVRIDLILLLTIFFGLYRGEIQGGLTGFMGGILEDSVSGSLMGTGTLSKTVVGSLSDFLGTKLYQKNILVQLVASFVLILIHEILYLSLIFFYKMASPLLSAAFKVTAITVLINTLLSPPFFWGMRRIFGRWQGAQPSERGDRWLWKRRRRRRISFHKRTKRIRKV